MMKRKILFLFVCVQVNSLCAMDNQELEQVAINLAAISQSRKSAQNCADLRAQEELCRARQKDVQVLLVNYRDASGDIFKELVKHNTMIDEDLHARGQVTNW